MKYFSLAIVALVIGCCVLSTSADGEQKCEPGSKFMDAETCNWCFCSADGLEVACTKKRCIKLSELEREKRSSPVKVCEPGTRFKDVDDCNWCTCNAAGTMAACTRKFCVPKDRLGAFNNQRTRRSSAKSNMMSQMIAKGQPVCEPGSRYLDADGCNWCTCNAEGTAGACTRRFCLPATTESPRSARQSDAEKCTPGQYFTAPDGCNTCSCNEDGTVGGCTEKACVSDPKFQIIAQQIAKNRVCEPGTRYLDADGCNWCTCNAEGTAGACTRRFCPPKEEVDTHSRSTRDVKKCTPGETYLAADGCNHCTCGEDGKHSACTAMFCLPTDNARKTRQVAEGSRCEPGKRFLDDDGCNWCTCSADGKMAACTRKFCFKRPQADRVARQTGRYCKPRSTFKQDCNTCRCSDDGRTAACTLRFCIPNEGRVKRDVAVAEVDEEEKQVCVPNSTFRDADDCNNCFCNEKGTLAACTLKLCIKFDFPKFTDVVEPEDNSTRVRRSGEGQYCVPNSTFKEDCNTCHCNAEGTNAACTLIGCPRRICEPNKITRAQDGCNTCRCNAEGTAQDCTEISCSALGGVVPTVCQPNSVFKEDCNTCKCSEDGLRTYCTRRACRPRRSPEEHVENKNAAQPTPCTPDDIKIEVN